MLRHLEVIRRRENLGLLSPPALQCVQRWLYQSSGSAIVRGLQPGPGALRTQAGTGRTRAQPHVLPARSVWRSASSLCSNSAQMLLLQYFPPNVLEKNVHCCCKPANFRIFRPWQIEIRSFQKTGSKHWCFSSVQLSSAGGGTTDNGSAQVVSPAVSQVCLVVLPIVGDNLLSRCTVTPAPRGPALERVDTCFWSAGQ